MNIKEEWAPPLQQKSAYRELIIIWSQPMCAGQFLHCACGNSAQACRSAARRYNVQGDQHLDSKRMV